MRGLLMLALLFAGCQTDKECPASMADFFKSVPTDAPALVSSTLSMELSIVKGMMVVDGKGDAFFVPPDTFRLDVLSDWGEALLSLRGGGNVLTVSVPMFGISGKKVHGLTPAALGKLLFAEPTLPGFSRAVMDSLVCLGESFQLVGPLGTCVYSNTNYLIMSFKTADGALSLTVNERESLKNGTMLPTLVTMKAEGLGSVRMRLGVRKAKPELSGGTLLN